MNSLKKFYNLFLKNPYSLKSYIKYITGSSPRNLKLYEQALKHSSISKKSTSNNERLEFLGDSVLSTIIADYIFKKYPYKDEGFLTEMRSKIVSREQLNTIGFDMGLVEYIDYEQKIDIKKSDLLGNCLEAFIGAFFLDQGYTKTEYFIIKKLLGHHIDVKHIEKSEHNFKGRLIEWCQQTKKEYEFKAVGIQKTRGGTLYTIAIIVDGEEIAKEKNFGKKNTEKLVAEKAYNKLKIGL